MGRRVEDLSARCHVKRMSRRKERLLLFLCATLLSLPARKKESSANAGCAHAQAAPPDGSSECISLAKLFAFTRASPADSRQRLREPIWATNSRRLCRGTRGSRGRLHFDEWRSGEAAFLPLRPVSMSCGSSEGQRAAISSILPACMLEASDTLPAVLCNMNNR